jgi:hypothetical protein
LPVAELRSPPRRRVVPDLPGRRFRLRARCPSRQRPSWQRPSWQCPSWQCPSSRSILCWSCRCRHRSPRWSALRSRSFRPKQNVPTQTPVWLSSCNPRVVRPRKITGRLGVKSLGSCAYGCGRAIRIPYERTRERHPGNSAVVGSTPVDRKFCAPAFRRVCLCIDGNVSATTVPRDPTLRISAVLRA